MILGEMIIILKMIPGIIIIMLFLMMRQKRIKVMNGAVKTMMKVGVVLMNVKEVEIKIIMMIIGKVLINEIS